MLNPPPPSTPIPIPIPQTGLVGVLRPSGSDVTRAVSIPAHFTPERTAGDSAASVPSHLSSEGSGAGAVAAACGSVGGARVGVWVAVDGFVDVEGVLGGFDHFLGLEEGGFQGFLGGVVGFREEPIASFDWWDYVSRFWGFGEGIEDSRTYHSLSHFLLEAL